MYESPTILAKLNAYGFHKDAIMFIRSYLQERKQRTKVNETYSPWLQLEYGVPQGSILGPLLFNIFINDLFYFLKDSKLANYADDNTIYGVGNEINHLLQLLERETSVVLRWFEMNEMKPNADKCHLIVCNQKDCSVILEDNTIEAEESVELLGITLDNDLKFSSHISKICKRANQKLHALARISTHMSVSKLKLLMKSFVISQFKYCPLVWMFCNRTLNNKINRLHERALRLAYKDYISTFEELLIKDNSVAVHHMNLQKLATEMFKIKNGLSPKPMENLFKKRIDQYDLRNKKIWESENIRTGIYGRETVSHMGPRIWNLVPNEIKDLTNISEFKRKIKKWKPEGCPCRICKVFIGELGFL